MPTLLPIRTVAVAERPPVPTMIASGLAFVILVAMTILTPTKYPTMFGASGPTSVFRY